jgi:hypothetical protein
MVKFNRIALLDDENVENWIYQIIFEHGEAYDYFLYMLDKFKNNIYLRV